MMIEPDFVLAAVAGGLVLLALALTAVVLRAQQRLRSRLAACEAAVAQVEHGIQSAATMFAATEVRLKSACDQIDRLTMQQGAIDATGHKAAFQQAIALMRRGASTAELVSVCGVSLGEARLIQTMYGSAARTPDEVTAN